MVEFAPVSPCRQLGLCHGHTTFPMQLQEHRAPQVAATLLLLGLPSHSVRDLALQALAEPLFWLSSELALFWHCWVGDIGGSASHIGREGIWLWGSY